MFIELTKDVVKYEPVIIKVDKIVSVEMDYDGDKQIRLIVTTQGTYKVKESFTDIKELLIKAESIMYE